MSYVIVAAIAFILGAIFKDVVIKQPSESAEERRFKKDIEEKLGEIENDIAWLYQIQPKVKPKIKKKVLSGLARN
jgi:hypothetical protein